MEQLDSSNYEKIKVTVRDEVIIMPVATGLKLMDYLTRDNTGSHVMITDLDGNQTVVNKHDIRKVSPTYKPKDLKEFT